MLPFIKLPHWAGAISFCVPIFVAYLTGLGSWECTKCFAVELGLLAHVTHSLARSLAGLADDESEASRVGEFGPLVAALGAVLAGPVWSAAGLSSLGAACLVMSLVAVDAFRGGAGALALTLAGAAWGNAASANAAPALLLLPALGALCGVETKADAKPAAGRFAAGAAPFVAFKAFFEGALASDAAALVAALRFPTAASAGATFAAIAAQFGSPAASAAAVAVVAVAGALLAKRGAEAKAKAKAFGLALACPLAFAFLVDDAAAVLAVPVLVVGLAAAVAATEGLARADAKGDVALVLLLAALLLLPAMQSAVILEGGPVARAAAPEKPAPPPSYAETRPPAAAIGDDDDDDWIEELPDPADAPAQVPQA